MTPKKKEVWIYLLNIYYCMTWRAIRGNIPFENDRIGPTEGRDDTEVENRIFPRITNRGIAIIDLLYDFHVTIGTGNNERLLGTGNNERAIWENIAL